MFSPSDDRDYSVFRGACGLEEVQSRPVRYTRRAFPPPNNDIAIVHGDLPIEGSTSTVEENP